MSGYDPLAHAELTRRAYILRKWIEKSEHRLPAALYTTLLQDMQRVDDWLMNPQRSASDHPALLGYGPSMMSLDLSIDAAQARGVIQGPHGPLALPGIKERALAPLRSILPLVSSPTSTKPLHHLRAQAEEIQRLIRRASPGTSLPAETAPATRALPSLLPISIQLPGVERATAFHILALADWLALRQIDDPDQLLRALHAICLTLEHDDTALRRLVATGNGTLHEAARLLRSLADALEPPVGDAAPVSPEMFLSIAVSTRTDEEPESLAHADDALLLGDAEREPITNGYHPAPPALPSSPAPAQEEEGEGSPPPPSFTPPTSAYLAAVASEDGPSNGLTPVRLNGADPSRALPLQPLVEQWLLVSGNKQASSALGSWVQEIQASEGRPAHLLDVSAATLRTFYGNHARTRSTRLAYRRHIRTFLTWLFEHGHLAGWERDQMHALDVPDEEHALATA